jgi:hypothetical protein
MFYLPRVRPRLIQIVFHNNKILLLINFNRCRFQYSDSYTMFNTIKKGTRKRRRQTHSKLPEGTLIDSPLSAFYENRVWVRIHFAHNVYGLKQTSQRTKYSCSSTSIDVVSNILNHVNLALWIRFSRNRMFDSQPLQLYRAFNTNRQGTRNRRRQTHKQVTRRHLDMITDFPLLARTVAEYVLLLWTMLTALSKLRKQQYIVAHQLQSISFPIFWIM